jgi:antitoxin (DNA-binding transcriptional repressor) of toxin-antitoxin stability system
MYNVQTMKRLKVAEARARFGEILDEAEKGHPVFIERRGVRFRVVAEPMVKPATAKSPLVATVDPAVITGQWSWVTGRRGLTFAARRKAR